VTGESLRWRSRFLFPMLLFEPPDWLLSRNPLITSYLEVRLVLTISY